MYEALLLRHLRAGDRIQLSLGQGGEQRIGESELVVSHPSCSASQLLTMKDVEAWALSRDCRDITAVIAHHPVNTAA